MSLAPSQDPNFQYRLQVVETKADKTLDIVTKLSEAVAIQQERQQAQGEDLATQGGTMTKMFWALITFAFTVAASAVGVALTAAG